MAEIATLGLRVDGTANIDSATQSLGRFSKSGQDAEKSADSLSKGSQRTSKSLSEVARQSETTSRGMSGLASAARNAGALIVASLGGLSFGRVISETAGFEQSLLGLQVVSGATAQQMEQLERQSRQLGATSMFSAQQAADAQNYLAMAGFNVNEVLSATPGLLELAAAGSMDLASAADLASNVLGGFRLQVDELGRVNDVLAAAAAGSNTSIQQLGQALSYAAPIAAAAGVSIEQTAAAIGVLSDAGLQGSRAGTGLLGVIRQLSNLTPNATSALNAYGLAAADVNVEQRGLNEVLEALSAANINAADSFKIFGSEAGPAAQILASGAVRVNEFTGELELAEGAARRAALILGSGLQGSFKSLTSAIGESTLQLGRDSGLSAGLQEVIDYATGVISVYNGMLDVFQDANDLSDDQTRSLNNTATALALAAGATGGLSAAYVVLTGAIWAANTAMTAFLKLLRVNPLVLAASAVVSLGGALYTARNRMIEFGDTQATISDWLRGAWEVNRDIITRTTGDAANAAIGAFESISAPVGAVFTYLWETFSALMGNIGRIAQVTINSVIGYWDSLTDVVAVVARTMQAMFRDAFSNILGVAGGFWESIQAVFTGDLSFSAFNAAVQNLQRGFTDALSEAADEIQSSVAENMSRDYLGEAFSGVQDGIGFVIDDFKDLGDQISEAAFIARMSRNSFGEVAEGFSEGKTEADLLQEKLNELNNGLGGSTEEVGKLTKAQRDAQRETEQLASAFRSLHDELNPIQAQQRQYQEDLDLLNNAHARAKELLDARLITEQEYNSILNERESLLAAVEARYRNSTQTAAGAYGGSGGFGAEIGSRGEVGSPTDPLARNEDDDYWTKWLESAETALTDFDALAANTAENFQRGFGDAFEAMVFDSQNFGDAMYNLFDGIARSLVNALGQMAAQWLAYQAVQLLVGKTTQQAAASATVTNALAKQQEAGLNAYAATAAIPYIGPIAAPAAMAAALAATTPAVTAITALSAAGMAHDGIDRIPREGTWLLDQGERVVSRPQADRLDAYLSRQERPQQSQAVAPVINITTPLGTTAQTESRLDKDEKWVIDVYVNNLNQGGRADKANRAAYGLSRQGV